MGISVHSSVLRPYISSPELLDGISTRFGVEGPRLMLVRYSSYLTLCVNKSQGRSDCTGFRISTTIPQFRH